jgi:hypothetical protein
MVDRTLIHIHKFILIFSRCINLKIIASLEIDTRVDVKTISIFFSDSANIFFRFFLINELIV